MIRYINVLKKLNRRALENSDVPVSALVIYENKILARGYNMREKRNNPLLHAEVVAIQRAAKKLKTWNLSDCQLITTLKPCNMCCEIIKNAKIKKVYYLLDNLKDPNYTINFNKIDDVETKYFEQELKSFFIDKR